MRDLDHEIDEWQKKRVLKKGKRAETVTDVLGDLADELLDFLELGIDDDTSTPGTLDQTKLSCD
jgi:hypothetical protein